MDPRYCLVTKFGMYVESGSWTETDGGYNMVAKLELPRTETIAWGYVDREKYQLCQCISNPPVCF